MFDREPGVSERESAIEASAEIRSRAFSPEPLPTPEGETWGRVVVVSPRLPFKVVHDAEGVPNLLPTDGGLVNALLPLLNKGNRGKWVGWSGTGGEEGLAEAARSESGQYEIGIISLTQEEEDKYYRGFFHEVLNPISLGRPDKVDYERADEYWEVYRSVQKKFAEKVIEDLHADDIVWIHEYHLAGVGRELRNLGVRQPMGYFLHMPFPNAEHFSVLPHREEFLRDLLACDIVGFQTKVFVDHFLDTVRMHVPEAAVERVSETAAFVHIDGRTVRVDNFPASIDSELFLEQLHMPDTQERIAELQSTLAKDGETAVIFNAGRLEYTKGFYEELLAFDRLLEKHPELVGKILLSQLIIPCREETKSYGEYKEKIVTLAREINQKYKAAITGVSGEEEETFQAYPDMPVRQMHAHMDRPLYIAHLHVADILDVPTLADGMNLVAKEGALVGKPTGVQILGETAGAAEELGHSALLVDPANTEALADAMYTAYAMREDERRERKSKLAATVAAHDVFQWWAKGQEPMFREVWNERTSAA